MGTRLSSGTPLETSLSLLLQRLFLKQSSIGLFRDALTIINLGDFNAIREKNEKIDILYLNGFQGLFIL